MNFRFWKKKKPLEDLPKETTVMIKIDPVATLFLVGIKLFEPEIRQALGLKKQSVQFSGYLGTGFSENDKEKLK